MNFHFKFYFNLTFPQKFYPCSKSIWIYWPVLFHLMDFIFCGLHFGIYSHPLSFLNIFIIAILKSLSRMSSKLLFSESISMGELIFRTDTLCWLCVFFVLFVMGSWHLLGHWQCILAWISALLLLCRQLRICFLLPQLDMLLSLSQLGFVLLWIDTMNIATLKKGNI